MNLTKRVGFLTGVAVLALPGVCLAASTDVNNNVDARIAELEAQVAQLKAASGEDWLTEQRAQEIRGLVQDVLADADTRTNLMAAGMTGGWDNGFWIGDAQGNFKLQMGGYIQARWSYDHVDENDADVDEDRWGFSNPRTKLFFQGFILNPTWRYKVQGNFAQMETDELDENDNFVDPNNGQFTLEDAYIEKDLENGFVLTGGQFKVPFLHEELVPETNMLAVDRSIVNQTFTTGRSQGFMTTWKIQDAFKLYGAVSDGSNQVNGGAAKYENEYAFTGRFEWKAAGTWKQFEDFASWKGEDMALLLGAALNWESQEYGDAAHDDELQAFSYTVDASFEGGGWGLYGAFVGRNLENNADGAAAIDSQQYAIIFQGSFMFTDDWEIFGRYEWGDPDSPDDVEDTNLSIITFGVNKYWAKNNLKWQTDFGFGLDALDPNWSTTSTDWRQDSPDSEGNLTDGQFLMRTQLQLVW